MSSSFHFAGDFIKTELDTFEDVVVDEKSALPGLVDLAKIIDTIIGKAKLSIKNICIKVFPPSLSSIAPPDALSFLSLSIAELKLKDHVAEDFDIPSELLGQDADILSFIVKYLVATETSAAFYPVGGSMIPLLKIPVVWARLLFSQQDHPLSPTPSPSPGDAPDIFSNSSSSSALFSDFQLKMFAYGIVSIVRLSDLKTITALFKEKASRPNSPVAAAVSSFLDSAVKSGFEDGEQSINSSLLDFEDAFDDIPPSDPSPSTSPNSSSPFQFSFFCNSANVCLVPSTSPPPSFEMYEAFTKGPSSNKTEPSSVDFWSLPHLLLVLEMIKLNKGTDGKVLTLLSRKLEVREFNPVNLEYDCILRPMQVNEFPHSPTSSVTTPATTTRESENSFIQVDFIPPSTFSSWSLSIHVESLVATLGLEEFRLWKYYLDTGPSPGPPTRNRPESDQTSKFGGGEGEKTGYIDIEVARILVLADLSLDGGEAPAGVYVDIVGLHLQKGILFHAILNNVINWTLVDELLMWTLSTPRISVGFFPLLSKSRTTACPPLSPSIVLTDVALQAVENQVSTVGLSEELMNFRHDLIRESVNFDTLSTKSWSDVDNGSESSPRDPPFPITQPTKADLSDPSLLKSVGLLSVSFA